MEIDPTSFGALLSLYRRQSGLSQLGLALEAQVSARHVGFLEVGRAQPSRSMITRLSDALRLDTPKRRRLYIAAGLLPGDSPSRPNIYRRSALAVTAMDTATAIYSAQAGDPSAMAWDFLRQLGVVHVATATLWDDNGILHLVGDPHGRPPASWLEHYVRSDYLQHDPVARWNLRGSGILHSSWFPKASLNTAQRRMFADAAEHGFRACVTVPAWRQDGRVRSFCGWTERVEPGDSETLMAIRFVAAAWLDAIEGAAPGSEWQRPHES